MSSVSEVPQGAARRAVAPVVEGQQTQFDPDRYAVSEVDDAEADADVPAETPVLIIGGGPVGLVTSILL